MFTSLKRIFKSGVLNFKRNLWLSIATIAITSIALFIFLSLMLFNFFTGEIIKIIENQIDLSIFFKNEVIEEDIIKTRDIISQLPQVAQVNYISKEQALEEFQSRHSEDEVINRALEELGDNPLQASLEIKAKDSSQYQEIVNFIETSDISNNISKVNFTENKLIIDRLNQITRTVERIGLILTIIFAGLTILIAFNFIRVSIYSFREEINIMRLVGASRSFIRGPFIVSGLITSIIAAITVFLIFWLLAYLGSPYVNSFVPEINFYAFFVQNWFKLFAFEFLAGIVLVLISTFLATNKYLKETA
ncbi:MAG TPA: permease-like cell division protein FtsX [Candidatus Paceibacterota bacterium]|nr:permease-like cell division protein FtsX [Candidatus Paceibacterota bacterium]